MGKESAPATTTTAGGVGHRLTQAERLRRDRRKGSYHLVAARSRLEVPPDHDDDDSDDDYDDEDESLFTFLLTTSVPDNKKSQLDTIRHNAKTDLLMDLAKSGGDVASETFLEAMDQLCKVYKSDYDARVVPPAENSSDWKTAGPQIEGIWTTLSMPKFSGSLGKNKQSQFMYSLGHMSFDMFRPSDLAMSIQGMFNNIHMVDGKQVEQADHVPKSLKAELLKDKCVIRTYDIVIAFTVEARSKKFGPKSSNEVVKRPIEGIMTTQGYVLPNPDNKDRVTVWFTGGSIEVNSDLHQWKKVFNEKVLSQGKVGANVKRFAAKMLMGATPATTMEEDGKLSYTFTRPLGGHEKAYMDLIYLDETLRIARSNTGAIYVFARVPYFPDE